MSFYQEMHQQPRTREIEQTFQTRYEEIRADLESLDLSFRDLAAKYNVNDRNVRRWCERLRIDPALRTKERRLLKLDDSKCRTQKSKNLTEDKPQAHKLVGLW